MIRIIVTVHVKPSMLVNFLMLAGSHGRLSRQEAGCKRFVVLRDADDEFRFVLDELWADHAAIVAHRQTEHYRRWRAEVPYLEAAPRTHDEYADDQPTAKRTDAAGLRSWMLDHPSLRVVVANGVFSILHPGHVHTLKFARAQGDVLIAAVNDDASAAQLKAWKTTLPLSDRMTMLEALACVDFVVPFSELTPIPLLSSLPRTGIVVKGPDYDFPGVVCPHGWEVRIAPPCAFTRHSSDLVA